MIPDCCKLLVDAVRRPADTAQLALRDWDDLLRLARRSNLVARLAEGIDHAGVMADIPTPVRPHLVAALRLSRHQRQAVVWEARHIGKALAALNIPVVLLKGAAYSMLGLQASRGRLYGDVDILVPEAQLNQVEAGLMLHGWNSGQTDPYDNRYYRQWMHELPPMVNIKRGTVIDVHHNILPRTSRHHPSAEKLLANAVALDEPPFYVFSPCDMVIHAATHLFHEGELQNGLRDLFDLDALLQEFSQQHADFWSALPTRARELGLVWPVRLAFRYLEYFLSTPIPQAAKSAMAGSEWENGMSDLLYRRGFLPVHPLCQSSLNSVSRGLLYLRGHALRMPAHLLALHLSRKAFMRLYKNTSRTI